MSTRTAHREKQDPPRQPRGDYPHLQLLYSRPTVYLRRGESDPHGDRYLRDALVVDVTNMGLVLEDDDYLLTFYPWSSIEKITEGDGNLVDD